MPVLALLPLWVFLYAGSLQPPEEEVSGPLAEGAAVYTACASCHGANGEGGVGYQLSNGEVLLTFPKIEDQLSFVYTGNTPFDGKPYGAPDRPGGQRVGGQLGAAGSMPAWGQNSGGTLTDQELLDVVCHERITISGEDPTNEQSIAWCTTDGEKYQQVVNEGLAAAGVNVPAG
jgi:mono/diheme cytochrome c family protein